MIRNTLSLTVNISLEVVVSAVKKKLKIKASRLKRKKIFSVDKVLYVGNPEESRGKKQWL